MAPITRFALPVLVIVMVGCGPGGTVGVGEIVPDFTLPKLKDSGFCETVMGEGAETTPDICGAGANPLPKRSTEAAGCTGSFELITNDDCFIPVL